MIPYNQLSLVDIFSDCFALVLEYSGRLTGRDSRRRSFPEEDGTLSLIKILSINLFILILFLIVIKFHC